MEGRSRNFWRRPEGKHTLNKNEKREQGKNRVEGEERKWEADSARQRNKWNTVVHCRQKSRNGSERGGVSKGHWTSALVMLGQHFSAITLSGPVPFPGPSLGRGLSHGCPKDTAVPALTETVLLHSPWSGRVTLNEALWKVRLLQRKVGNPSWLRQIAWG